MGDVYFVFFSRFPRFPLYHFLLVHLRQWSFPNLVSFWQWKIKAGISKSYSNGMCTYVCTLESFTMFALLNLSHTAQNWSWVVWVAVRLHKKTIGETGVFIFNERCCSLPVCHQGLRQARLLEIRQCRNFVCRLCNNWSNTCFMWRTFLVPDSLNSQLFVLYNFAIGALLIPNEQIVLQGYMVPYW